MKRIIRFIKILIKYIPNLWVISDYKHHIVATVGTEFLSEKEEFRSEFLKIDRKI